MKKRSIAFYAVLLGCATAFGAKKQSLFVSGKETRPVLYYADQDIDGINSNAVYAVVIVHGKDGATVDHTLPIRAALEADYPDLLDQIVFVAPGFLTRSQAADSYSKYAFWESGGWTQGDDSPVVTNLSSYDVMDHIMSLLSDPEKYPNLKHVFLGGFSGGGQYAIRYLCLGTFPQRAGVKYDVAIGAPSAWLYINGQRVLSDGTLGTCETDYPGYNDWKYGLDNRGRDQQGNRYVESVTFESVVQHLKAHRVLCYCGTKDTGSLDSSNGALAQGAGRLERYNRFKTYAEAHPEWYSTFSWTTIDGVAHEREKCYKDERIVDFAMGHELGWRDVVHVWHVDASAASDGEGLSADAPLRSLSSAVAQASDGDRIVVAPGVYAPIVTKGKLITVEGKISGGEVVIDGGGVKRCIDAGAPSDGTNTVFRNLIVRNGRGGSGGGAFGGIFERCTFVGNFATNNAGGAYKCTLTDCLVVSNTAFCGGGVANGTVYRSRILYNTIAGAGSDSKRKCGGGVYNCSVYDSQIVGNRAEGTYAYGGGCHSGKNYNCTICGNYAWTRGGGVYCGTSKNCVIWTNVTGKISGSGSNDNHHDICLVDSATCQYCLSGYSTTGKGNIRTNDPGFVSFERGDYRLKADSPCLNAGLNGAVAETVDLAGHARIQDGTVDIGAYEGVADATVTTPVEVPYEWLDGFPTLTEGFPGDYEGAANAKTGKRTASGGAASVWEDYVAGTNPTNAASRFEVSIDCAAGAPRITWNPDLGARRTYRIWGCTNLADAGAWECPTNAQHRFFKVTVDLPNAD